MLWSQLLDWLLTDECKFLLANHVLILTSSLTTDRWFQIFTDTSCFDLNSPTDNWPMILNFYRQIMFWSWLPHGQPTDDFKVFQGNHVLNYTSFLTADRWFQIWLENHVLILTSSLTAGRWFQIFSGKSCFDLIILADNWQMIPNLNWRVLLWPQHPYWQLTDNSKF